MPSQETPDYFTETKLGKKLNKWMDFLKDYVHASFPLTETNTPSGRIINSPQVTQGLTSRHNYSVVNASSAATPKVIVTNGNHIDSGSGNTIVPTISGTPINNSTPPKLTVAGSDTLVYFHGTAAAGVTSAIEILSGTDVPASDTGGGDWYQKVADITVVISGGVAIVTSKEGGVSTSQDVGFCAGLGWGFGGQ